MGRRRSSLSLIRSVLYALALLLGDIQATAAVRMLWPSGWPGVRQGSSQSACWGDSFRNVRLTWVCGRRSHASRHRWRGRSTMRFSAGR
jgi:hypothetical protein